MAGDRILIDPKRTLGGFNARQAEVQRKAPGLQQPGITQ